ncbi:hypothetical protein ACJX0J_027297 [Zea mays]
MLQLLMQVVISFLLILGGIAEGVLFTSATDNAIISSYSGLPAADEHRGAYQSDKGEKKKEDKIAVDDSFGRMNRATAINKPLTMIKQSIAIVLKLAIRLNNMEKGGTEYCKLIMLAIFPSVGGEIWTTPIL